MPDKRVQTTKAKTAPVDEARRPSNNVYPPSDNAPTDARIEPINVQPGDEQEAVERQEETNDARLEADRQEYFKQLTEINPTEDFMKTVTSMGGLPGNQSPAMNEIARGRVPDAEEIPEFKAMKEQIVQPDNDGDNRPDNEKDEQRKDQLLADQPRRERVEGEEKGQG